MATKEFFELRKQIIERSVASMNEMQRQAIFHTEGPLLILAGAGSGKTTVIVNRIAHLVRYGKAYHSATVAFEPDAHDMERMRRCAAGDDSVLFELRDLLAVDAPRPWQILAITFTNKAAGELKERLESLLGSEGKDVWAGTFHACCARILRRDGAVLGYTPSFTIYDTDDSRRLMKECMRQLDISEHVLSHKTILGEISKAKDALVSPDEFLSQAGPDIRLQKIGKAYKLYQAELKKANAMDFDDIIGNTVLLLEQYDDVRDHYQRRFRYVMVDEYQDTNHAQFRLTALLAGGHKNICVVGDDDQSIYRFRGATIENILNFESQYAGAATIRLEQNYRSTQTILDAANEIIANNTQRKGKRLWTGNGQGDKVVVHTAYDEQEEARFIADTIAENVASKAFAFHDHAVLYRMNAQSNAVESALVRAGIPYRVIGGFRFYERAEIKDALAYLTVVNNPGDNLRLRRIVNVPKRGIGETTVNRAFEIATGLGVSLFEVISHADEYELLRRSAPKLMAFAALIADLHDRADGLHLDELFKEILNRTAYLDYLKADAEKGPERLENISELLTNLLTYELENEEPTLAGFLEEVALLTDIDNYNAQADAVVLMTLHSAKGLEFPVVLIPGMEEGVFPGFQSMVTPGDVEEERRLAYVGVTRAKKKLYLIHANTRMLFGSTARNLPSRFLDEIPDRLTRKTGRRAPGMGSMLPDDAGDGPIGGLSRYMGTGYLNRAKPSAQPKRKPAQPSGVVYNVGDTVTSKVFGRGVVLSVKPMGSDRMLEIAFETAGTKKLMANYAKLEKSE
ncbi:MAG: UvrD-helicase domain-containing protein [Clostridia bacterium]|nr:UvrD-helicase domain-containing protein [Clostridia bacterium]